MRKLNTAEYILVTDLKREIQELTLKRVQKEEEVKMLLSCRKDIEVYLMKRLDIKSLEMKKLLYN